MRVITQQRYGHTTTMPPLKRIAVDTSCIRLEIGPWLVRGVISWTRASRWTWTVFVSPLPETDGERGIAIVASKESRSKVGPCVRACWRAMQDIEKAARTP